MNKKQIIIIGAGASGLTAAIMAARNGAKVTLLEQNEKAGKKICATGNGKCNLTNLNQSGDVYRGSNPSFAKKTLNHFSVEDTLRFFEEIGISTVSRNGYLYPRSNQAQSVVDVLTMEARSLGVKLKTREKVTGIFRNRETHKWEAATEGWTYEGDALILANGSKASAISGSDGSGYTLAGSQGHRIIPLYPALTALKCKGNFFKGWAGVRAEGKLTLFIDNAPVKSEQGELQLTEYGVSGIPVFQLSRYAIRAVHENHKAEIVIDFFPERERDELAAILKTRKASCPYKNEKELLAGLFPEKLIQIFTGKTFDRKEKTNKTSSKQTDFSKKTLPDVIKSFRLEISDGMPFAQAQVCSGGVDTDEVDAVTMESRLAKGLYFAGELLDIDGTCGGYNLQWAWSSGAAAGIHAAGETWDTAVVYANHIKANHLKKGGN